jgi:hypothetical protein
MDDDRTEEPNDELALTSPQEYAVARLAAQAERRQAVAHYHAQIAAFPVTMGGPPPIAQIGPDGMLIGIVVALVAIFFFMWLGTTIHLYRVRRAQLMAQQPLPRGQLRFQAQMHARRTQLGRR